MVCLLEKGGIFRFSHLKQLKRGRWRGVVCAWEKQRKEEGWEEAEECTLGKTGEEKRERERERNEECRMGKTGEEKRERNFLNLIIWTFWIFF